MEKTLLVTVQVVAAGLAAALAADWVAGAVTAACVFLVSAVAVGVATAAAAERFVDEVESPELDDRELALARRVGLDLATVREAKAEVKAAVRAVMVRRGAGLAALCAPGPAALALAVRERARAARGAGVEGSLESGKAAELPEAPREAGCRGTGSASVVSAAEASGQERRDDVE